jgi:hypothetical protein
VVIKGLAIFIVMALTDFLWASYIDYIAKGKPIQSALYASAVSLVGSVATIVYVADHWMVIPITLGAFVGTYICVKLRSRNSKTNETK